MMPSTFANLGEDLVLAFNKHVRTQWWRGHMGQRASAQLSAAPGNNRPLVISDLLICAQT